MDRSTSVLTSVKKMLGLEEAYDVFDNDILMHINANLAILCQEGIGPAEGISIENKDQTWEIFTPSIPGKVLDMLPTYLYIKVKLAFDPPESSKTAESYENMAREYEIRMYTELNDYLPGVEPKPIKIK